MGGLVTQDTSFVSPICYLMMGRKNSGLSSLLGFPGGSNTKKKICLQYERPGFDPWFGKIPCRRKWQPTSAFLPGKSLGQRSLVGYSPWGHKESDTTERLTHTSSLLVHAQLSHPFTPL